MIRSRKCAECGGEMRVSREDYRYDESGLSDVVLVAIDVRRCTCGAVEPVIGNIEGLHRALARAIVEKPARLAGEEVRFLRTYLGFRSVDFAAVMGVDKATVSRWESEDAPIGGQADRALRLLVQTQKPVSDYSAEVMAKLLESIKEERRALPGRFERRSGGWSSANQDAHA